ncbi:MAG: metallophosphoesterase [Deltaproteobacteria bacterium]|nr:metallophosphoesterase [Deltaproteobacteria bacterium]
MWFIYVAAGLALLAASGIYARRRIAASLAHFGVRTRTIRIVRWAIIWLLFGFPLLMILSVVISLALGRSSFPRFDGMLGAWLLGIPFLWAVLVVMQSVIWLIAIDIAHAVVRRRRGQATAARMRAIAVLVVIGAFAIYIPVRVIAERNELRMRTHAVGAATAGSTPFRIAFIADVQQDVHFDAERAREVYDRVNAGKPDVVLSGGDWINTGPEHIEAAAETAAALTSRLGTFSVRGDHEHFAYIDRERSVGEVEAALRRHHIQMLNNEVRWFEHNGKRIAVAFLNYNYIFRSKDDAIDKLLGGLSGADYKILVTHQLDRRLASHLENKVDLVLAAHTHGGQINPVVGLVHVSLARVETAYVDGRYQLGDTTIIVTAGVGYSLIPIRYASPGSVELIELGL